MKARLSIDAIIILPWFSQAQKNKILAGRNWIDDIRNNVHLGHKVKWQKLITFYQNMLAAGFDFPNPTAMVEYFFYISKTMNVQAIGYQTIEDFNENATTAEREQLEGMWK